ncbi:MAG: benzoyl-CoA 2,3-epoxidase subunit BoxB, partial [Planctomycetota bacterium]|nr:benzoyl-CoA 2,3-epoxidase subunit BoxB [Planctomycetota bacterium]
MALQDQIPNNVDLNHDRRLKKALESWQPKFIEWWKEMGPEGFQENDVYLRTAVSVDRDGWADYKMVKMPEYRWGIFLTPEEKDRKVGFGDMVDMDSFDQVPGEFRNALRRLVVTQGDTEPGSVEQQRLLGKCAPSLYDMRNLFQVNVEEGRHLWAMVYLLHRFFGKDGREEADDMLERRSGNEDKPRILEAFNQPIDDWLSFYCFTMFVDRDGKFQLAALAESGFSPLRRSCRFMLTEESHHLYVGDTGISRTVRRSAQLTKESGGDPYSLGGIPLEIVQKYINYWVTYAMDLFGGEVSSNAADFFAAGLKGRFNEMRKYDEHTANEGTYDIPVVKDGKLVSRSVPTRNAMNEILRDDYIADSDNAIRRWNKIIADEGCDFELKMPNRRFHR